MFFATGTTRCVTERQQAEDQNDHDVPYQTRRHEVTKRMEVHALRVDADAPSVCCEVLAVFESKLLIPPTFHHQGESKFSPAAFANSRNPSRMIAEWIGISRRDALFLRRFPWKCITWIPSTSSGYPKHFAALPATIEGEDSIEIDVDDQVLSMFSLTTCLERMSATPRIASIAENWTTTPLGARTSWDQWVGYDKAIQAQILGVTSPTQVMLDSEVPEWLPLKWTPNLGPGS